MFGTTPGQSLKQIIKPVHLNKQYKAGEAGSEADAEAEVSEVAFEPIIEAKVETDWMMSDENLYRYN